MSLIASAVDIKVTLHGADDVDAEIHRVITRALKMAMRETIEYMYEIVPESDAQDRYPDSYKSEDMLETAITYLRAHINELKRSGIQVEYVVPMTFTASYAKDVNKAKTTGTWTKGRGKGWTKAGSQAGFFQKTRKFFKESYCRHIRKELAVKSAIEKGVSQHIAGV